MKTRERDYRWARRFAAVAGSMDFGTGLGLVFLPTLVLPLMGVKSPGAEAMIYLRWVGAFVAAVGAIYLLALLRGGRLRLRVAFELTLLFRLAAGLYSAWAIVRGDLSMAWISVPISDLGLVAAQAWFIRREDWSRD